MKLNEYGIFEYSKNGHSLDTLPEGRPVLVRKFGLLAAAKGRDVCDVPRPELGERGGVQVGGGCRRLAEVR